MKKKKTKNQMKFDKQKFPDNFKSGVKINKQGTDMKNQYEHKGFTIKFNMNDPEDKALYEAWQEHKQEKSINNCHFFKRYIRTELAAQHK